jgi:hypothetical protein
MYRAISCLEKFRLGLWKALGFVFFGNRDVELGDCVIDDGEFFHYFSSREDFVEEIRFAGLKAEISVDQEAFFIQV